MASTNQRERRSELRKAAKAKRRLTNVRVDELSLVDRPAIARNFVIAKRDTSGGDMTATTETPAAAPAATTEAPATPATPAAPAAKVETPVVKAEVSDETVKLAKAREEVGAAFAQCCEILRSVANQMPTHALYMLANMIDHTTNWYGDLPAVSVMLRKSLDSIEADPVLLEKSSRVIGAANFGKINTAIAKVEEAKSTLNDVIKAAKRITKSESPEGQDEPTTETQSPVEKSNGTAATQPAAATSPAAPAAPSLMDEASALLLKSQADRKAADEAAIMAALQKTAEAVDATVARMNAFDERLNKAVGKVA